MDKRKSIFIMWNFVIYLSKTNPNFRLMSNSYSNLPNLVGILNNNVNLKF